MKRRIALLTAAVLLLSLLGTACGTSAGEAGGAEEQTGKAAETAEGTQNAAAILDVPPSDEPAPAEEPDDAQTGSAAPEEKNAPAGETSAAPEEQDETPAPTATSTQAVVTSTAPTATPTQAAVTSTTPAVTPAPASVASTAPSSEPTPVPTPTPGPAGPTLEAAMAYIGKSASSMIAAIGAPLSRSYVPSCLGDGEDGELVYDGFTVYTYREGGSETVQDVL